MKGPLTAAAWNALLDRLAPLLRNRIMSVTALGGGKWLHPWHTSVKWNATEKRWEATIKPGFVNGLDVTVSITPPLQDSTAPSSVPLTDSPTVPLTTFRPIGTDAISIDGSGESVPEYFRVRGVGDPVSLSTEGEDGIVQQVSGLADAQSSQRLLRACEILLYHDRPAAEAQWTQGVGIDGTFAQFAIAYNAATGAKDHGYLRVAKESPLVAADTDAATAAFLGESFADTPYDWKKVATVYLLSPADAAFDSEPDETWQPHVKHHLFWNLHYAHSPIPPAANNQPLTLNTAGLGGAGVNLQATVNQMLAQSNDASAALNEMLRSRVKGRFWTV